MPPVSPLHLRLFQRDVAQEGRALETALPPNPPDREPTGPRNQAFPWAPLAKATRKGARPRWPGPPSPQQKQLKSRSHLTCQPRAAQRRRRFDTEDIRTGERRAQPHCAATHPPGYQKPVPLSRRSGSGWGLNPMRRPRQRQAVPAPSHASPRRRQQWRCPAPAPAPPGLTRAPASRGTRWRSEGEIGGSFCWITQKWGDSAGFPSPPQSARPTQTPVWVCSALPGKAAAWQNVFSVPIRPRRAVKPQLFCRDALVEYQLEPAQPGARGMFICTYSWP